MSGRRQFLRDATSNIAAMAALGAVAPRTPSPNGDWDLAWPTRLTGTRRALLDGTEIESGAAVCRARVWAGQGVSVLGVSGADVSPVIVLRSHAVALALHRAKHGRAYLHAS